MYGVADCKTNQRVTEEGGLERFPGRRGDYSASKQAAEDLVRWAMGRKRFPVVVLRPGTIYGPGGDLFSPMMGLSLGNKLFVVFGMGSFVLPYVYIDNVVDAIIASLRSERANDQILNIVDNHRITKQDYLRNVIRKAFPAPMSYVCRWHSCIGYSGSGAAVRAAQTPAGADPVPPAFVPAERALRQLQSPGDASWSRG